MKVNDLVGIPGKRMFSVLAIAIAIVGQSVLVSSPALAQAGGGAHFGVETNSNTTVLGPLYPQCVRTDFSYTGSGAIAVSERGNAYAGEVEITYTVKDAYLSYLGSVEPLPSPPNQTPCGDSLVPGIPGEFVATQPPLGTAQVTQASIKGNSLTGSISCNWTSGTWQRRHFAQRVDLPAALDNCVINEAKSSVSVVHVGTIYDPRPFSGWESRPFGLVDHYGDLSGHCQDQVNRGWVAQNCKVTYQMTAVAVPAVEGPAPELPTISIKDNLAINENAGPRFSPALFDVTVTGEITQPIVVRYAAGDGDGADLDGDGQPDQPATLKDGDYTPTAGSFLVFQPGGPKTQQASIRVVNESAAEPAENFYMHLGNPRGATLGDDQATGTILANDN